MSADAVSATLEDGTLHLRGVLDASSARAALAAVAAATAAAAPRRLALSDVTRVDSAGLALLVGWRRTFGSDLQLVGAPQAVRSLAEISGIEAWLLGDD